mgnify:FL=1
MDATEVSQVLHTLKRFYPCFVSPKESTPMHELWHTTLQPYERTLVLRAVRRWARQQYQTDRIPSLDQLCEQAEWLQDDDRRVSARSSSGTGRVDTVALLCQTAAAQGANPHRSAAEASYGQFMCLLASRHLEPWYDHKGIVQDTLTQAQMAEQCYRWGLQARAHQRWALATDLEAAGTQWEQWAREAGQIVTLPEGNASGVCEEDDPALAFLT